LRLLIILAHRLVKRYPLGSNARMTPFGNHCNRCLDPDHSNRLRAWMVANPITLSFVLGKALAYCPGPSFRSRSAICWVAAPTDL